MCSDFRVLVRTRAAQFWTYCTVVSGWFWLVDLRGGNYSSQSGADECMNKFFGVMFTEGGSQFGNVLQMVKLGLADGFDMCIERQ